MFEYHSLSVVCLSSPSSKTCYQLHKVKGSTKITWMEASINCTRNDTELLSIVDINEMDFIHQWLKTVNFTEDDRIVFIGK